KNTALIGWTQKSITERSIFTMTAFSHSAFLQSLGWAVLNSVWQMAFLWIIYNVSLSIPRNVRPAHKSAIAVTMLITGFAWFLFTFISLYMNRDNNSAFVTLNGLSAGMNENLNNWLDTILPFASILYIALLIVPVIRFIKNYRYVQVLKRYNLSRINVEWIMFVRRVAEQIGITKPVHIWVSDLVTSPVTIGYLKPIILVPLAAMNNLTSQQMEAVLLHELAHIRRYDYLFNLIINFIQAILYFNPFVKAFVKTVERERERSCDEMVIQFQYDPHNYATALLTLEKNNSVTQNMAIAATSGKNDLLNRIERILKIDSNPVFTFNKLAGLFAGLFCIIMLNALIVVGKPAVRNSSIAFEQLTTPFFLFGADDEKPAKENKNIPAGQDLSPKKEVKTPAIVNHAATAKIENNDESGSDLDNMPAADEDALEADAEPVVPSFADVKTVIAPSAPKLNILEIKHVEQTVEATKKIVEDVQWKEVEKSIADALTQVEKDQVKENYDKELQKVNWKKLETKLKASYDQLNWEQINDQVGSAIINIKLDSLVKVFSIVKENLDKAEKLATTCDTATSEMPMPDVSVENIRQSKDQVQKNLSMLKALRSRKIIHL
ncbi:MAG: M56 family metallopeptidase, partial [Bacteroidota bacterium]